MSKLYLALRNARAHPVLFLRASTAVSVPSPQTHNNYQQSHSRFSTALLLGGATLALLLSANSNLSECEEAPRQDRIRGTYENKIRFFSPPEKIFETFAHSKDADGKLVMSYADFFRALTPYNYTEIKDNKPYFEKYQPDVLKVADANGDGVISFPEFLFFITLLQLPIGLLAKEFAKVDAKEMKMNRDQFTKTFTNLRKKTLLGQKQTNKSGILDARNISAKEEDFLAANDEIIRQLFTGREHSTLKDFIDFREKLKTALRHYEFHQYGLVDEEKESISVEDFAKSLLVCLPLNHINKYLKRINQIKLEGEVTFVEFIAFQRFIDDVDNIKEKVLAYRYITVEQLRQLADEFTASDDYCKSHKVRITDAQINALVKLLDLDDNGQLDHDEVVGVLEERQMLGQGRDAEIKEAISGGVAKGFQWLKDTLKI
ncbi:hypothetical protein FGO68_gene3874 [Halteria grandinella]|uniref:EF-hand domain-containing protein n=1 Tax=Halteria grandinella TaxID=5974 RepID=A0A8J8NWQ6_HALGN|nr:hypothetical protein FGO68_gene3874 [Halteria grandinella]